MLQSSEWVAAWREESGAAGSVESPALAGALEAVVAAGAARWPGVPLPPEDFVRHLARAAAGTAGPPLDALAHLHVTNLYLACACARGLAEALAGFETAHLVSLGASLAGAVSVGAEEVDEIRQRLRVKLLVGEPARGRPPLVASYGGRGALAAWVRVAAVREALTLVRDAGIGARATRRAAAEGALDAFRVDPELAVIKDRYRQDFAEAFAGALRGIAARERALLRLHTVAGLSLEKIGAIYKVDRSTVSRWLADARHALLDGTERGLRERLGLGPVEVESMARLLTSQLEIDLPELLRTSS